MARKRKSPSSESDVSLHSEDENTTPTLENNQKESVEEAAKALGRNANTRKTGISKHECSGHIESIELVDFMCHRHLLVAFKPQINFVIGNNGSGKSAILTALTVCLGGRASATQRATSVVSLIREGAQSGKVKVKLNNQGDNPYMPEKYGDHITIERSFRREGSNAYSIYDENDRFVIGRREEIISICDHFSIQVDNPLAVLTQETAKKFLANSKPKELYEEHAKLSEELESKRKNLEEILRSIEDHKTKHDQLESQIKELEESLASEQTRLNPLLAQKTNLASTIISHEDSLTELKVDAKQINAESANLKKQLDELTDRIAREAKGASGRQDQLRAKLTELEHEQIRLNELIFDEHKKEDELTRKLSHLQESLQAISEKRSQVDNNLSSAQKMIQQAELCKGNRVRAFGEKMPDVLKEIQKAKNSFKNEPIGPAGLYIKLKDSKWALAIESIIGANLEAFVVNDHSDRVTLQKIFKKHGLDNPIIVLRYAGDIDVSKGLPDARFVAALNVLEIDNPVVRKMLVILSQIESNALIEDRHEAMQAMRQRPRNVQAIYTTSARINAGSRSISLTQLSANPKRPRLIEDFEERIVLLKRKLQEYSHEKSILAVDFEREEAAFKSLQGQLQTAKSSIVSSEQRTREIKTQSRQAQDELCDQNSVPQNVFEEEKQKTEQKMETMKAQYQANEDQRQELTREKNEFSKRLKILENEISKIRSDHQEMIEEISSTVRTRRGLERDTERFQRQLVTEQEVITNCESSIHKMVDELEQMKSEATEVCPRVHVRRTVRELDTELAAQEEFIRTSEYSSINPLEIKRDLDAKKVQFCTSEKSIRINARLIASLSDTLEKRHRAWEDFRRQISKASTTDFIFMLHSRSFEGTLDYRHHDGELHIRVIPQGQQKNTQIAPNPTNKRHKGDILPEIIENRDVRQLSGGEKSYSTACFLFSLWQAMSSPLRCLDEFDVYMVTQGQFNSNQH